MMIRLRLAPFLAFPAAFALLLTPLSWPASAQRAPTQFRDWSVSVVGSGKAKTCYAFAAPKKARGKYKKRGEIFVLVSRGVGRKASDEVSVHAGYSYKKGSMVTVRIGGATFKMFTQGDKAWAEDAANDRALVAAMRAGREMVIKGVSSRGTLTTDTYSLFGFTAARKATARACAK